MPLILFLFSLSLSLTVYILQQTIVQEALKQNAPLSSRMEKLVAVDA